MPIKVIHFQNPFKSLVKEKDGTKVVVYNGKEYKQVSKKR